MKSLRLYAILGASLCYARALRVMKTRISIEKEKDPSYLTRQTTAALRGPITHVCRRRAGRFDLSEEKITDSVSLPT
ncbi:hypothetical protein EVAR_31437_1 [Eumeta japonica]|uniref:Secreted protein n=1 Tax=Eumeta variegata TaxID=151549 RepID=A0A4C1UXU2_EUMVA|nr:hypothetical protein EVAR_31437_1 [Eumeta japonica]